MKIEPIYFITAIFVTLFVLYVFSPKPEIVVKYPDLNREVSDVYVDDQGVCYRYHRVEVESDKIQVNGVNTENKSENKSENLQPVKEKIDVKVIGS